MKLILLCNDDGIDAPGLAALEAELSRSHETLTVAPDREQSATGHSLTIRRPLRLTKRSEGRYCLDGTPTDCIAIALNRVVDKRPDLIVSGINNGPNLGDDITYSGTVAAALEGTIMNIPSIAVSVNVLGGQTARYDTAARVAAEFADIVLDTCLPYDTLLNINVPNIEYDAIKGTRMTRQGKRVYDGAIQDSPSPWGEKYYWIGGGTPYWEQDEDTDIQSVLRGYVSVTPLHLDMTNYWARDFLTTQWKKRITGL